MLTEFGGIAFVDHERETVSGAWGYGASADVPTFRRQYRALLKAVQELKLFRGFCYTQLTDTFQEANGLLYADRTPKLSLAEIHAVTRGHGHERVEVEVDGDHDEPYLRAVGREREGLTS
jgi:hypothetical protein